MLEKSSQFLSSEQLSELKSLDVALSTVRFLDLLLSMGLNQHIDFATHVSGNTLDLSITRSSDSRLNIWMSNPMFILLP